MLKVDGLNQSTSKSEFTPPDSWVKIRTKAWDPKEYLHKSGIASKDPYKGPSDQSFSSAAPDPLVEVPDEDYKKLYYKIREDSDRGDKIVNIWRREVYGDESSQLIKGLKEFDFRELDEWITYLEGFESAASHAGWNDRQKINKLLLRLRGVTARMVNRILTACGRLTKFEEMT